MITAVLLNYQGKITDTKSFFPKGTDAKLTVDQKGIAHACNMALKLAFEDMESDYCLILANDIQEPEDTISKRLEVFKDIPSAGIVTMPIEPKTRQTEPYLTGSFMISKELFSKIGYFDTRYDEYGYGPIDLDYCLRSTLAGFKNCNVITDYAVHLDNGDKAYGFSKREVLKKYTWRMFQRRSAELKRTKEIYLPFKNENSNSY